MFLFLLLSVRLFDCVFVYVCCLSICLFMCLFGCLFAAPLFHCCHITFFVVQIAYLFGRAFVRLCENWFVYVFVFLRFCGLIAFVSVSVLFLFLSLLPVVCPIGCLIVCALFAR